jgi:hypothetical protein
MIQIEVDDEVFQALKMRAEPFEDTPNSVLRREFDLDEGTEGREEAFSSASGVTPTELDVSRRRGKRRGKAKARGRGTRAPAGSLLPETEYVDPILRVITSKGGRAPTREVIEEVGNIIGDRLTPLDKEKMSSGAVRWHNRVQFTRLRMIDQGLLKRGSPRGVWEIADEGARQVSSESAA